MRVGCFWKLKFFVVNYFRRKVGSFGVPLLRVSIVFNQYFEIVVVRSAVLCWCSLILSGSLEVLKIYDEIHNCSIQTIR